MSAPHASAPSARQEPRSPTHRAATAILAGTVALLALLTLFPVLIGLVESRPATGWLTAWAALELVVIIAFAVWLHGRIAVFARPAQRLELAPLAWAGALVVPVGGMIALAPEAGYAAIALFFVVLWLLPAGWGTLATVGLALLVVAGQSVHHGFSFGTVTGPTVSALVAIGIMLSTRALVVSNERNERLVAELRATQAELARSEREQGRLAERTRLGQELHDTVAQHLSSIGLLLGAAQRAEGTPTAAEHIERAREAAADALAQTRAFIRDLAPPQLEGATLASALGRLAEEASRPFPDAPAATAALEVRGVPRPAPMAIETALLRVAQESIANARRHGRAGELQLVLDYADGALSLEVHDDGVGFDADAWFAAPARGDGTGFGLAAMRDRLDALGGFVVIVSDPGEGTLVRAQVPLPSEPAEQEAPA